MKTFAIPLLAIDPWDDVEDIFSTSTENPSEPASDYTTPPDEFPD